MSALICEDMIDSNCACNPPRDDAAGEGTLHLIPVSPVTICDHRSLSMTPLQFPML